MQMSLGLPAFWGTWTSHCNAPSMHYLSKLLLYIHAGFGYPGDTEVKLKLLLSHYSFKALHRRNAK